MTAADDKAPLRNCRQCIVVVAEDWSATTGRMSLFERAIASEWQEHGSAFPVVLGKTGLGVGRGMIDLGSTHSPSKKEGDNRSPAGVFKLGSAFGYAPRNPGTRMPYIALTSNHAAVDDAASRYYNQIVDQARIGRSDWRSAEKMILPDDRYKWGLVVEHNVPPEPGAGSCIFLHVWKSPATPTTGCTAMSEPNMLELLRWLDPRSRPLLIQLPQPLYIKRASQLGLPRLQLEVGGR